jgi:uncharacterized membrane protein
MKIKLLVGAVIVLIIVNLAALGSFWFMHAKAGQGRDTRPGREWRMRNFGRDMPRDERERLLRMVQGFRRETRPLIEETRDLENQLMEAMRQGSASREHIDSLNVAIAQSRLEIARRATERMIALGDSLNPDQREEMMKTLMRYRRSQYDDGQRPRWLSD